MSHKAHTHHKDFDLFHAVLLELLDRIEVQENPELAEERFEIVRNFGYEVVEVPDNEVAMR